MQDAFNLNAIALNDVIDDIIANRKTSQTFSDFVAWFTDQWLASQHRKSCAKGFNDAVGRTGIVVGDISAN